MEKKNNEKEKDLRLTAGRGSKSNFYLSYGPDVVFFFFFVFSGHRREMLKTRGKKISVSSKSPPPVNLFFTSPVLGLRRLYTFATCESNTMIYNDIILSLYSLRFNAALVVAR